MSKAGGIAGPPLTRARVEILIPERPRDIAVARTAHPPLRALIAPWTEIAIARWALLLAATSFGVHALGWKRYGFFRDELYYIACGNHLAFGYVDQPPLVAVIARLSSILFGNSMAGFRFFPALAGAGMVLLTAGMARELGGGRFAEILASLTALAAPLYLAFGSFLSMNAFEPLLWLACAYLFARIVNGADERLWLAVGAVAGVGLQNKHTMLMFVFGVIAGMVLTRDWRHLRSKWLWLGAGLALLIFLPNLTWEARNGWPQFEVVRNCQRLKNVPVSGWRFLGEQLLFANPLSFPVIAAGVGWLFFAKQGRRFRALGWAYVIVLTVVFALHGKTYYPMPFYPILLAAGSVAIERALRARPKLHKTYVAALALSGVIMLPFSVPVLPLPALLRYQQLVQLHKSVHMERDPEGEVHQLYGDMLVWQKMVTTVAGVYGRLPAAEQKQCAILAGNYGEAGAIDLIGGDLGLPKAISPENSYYFWGSRGYTGEVVIVFGQHAERTKQMFASVEVAGTISDAHAIAAENHLPVYICRRPVAPLEQLWPLLRYYE